MKRLDLIVGPNGSGKTTFVTKFLAPLLPESVFVNADEIAKQLWPDEDPAPRAYEAARIAQQTRQALINQGGPFIAETVFSHPSKLDLIRSAQAAGYIVRLLVLLVPEELTVTRVAARVEAGGHSVPLEKIRARYQRLWPLIVEATTLADTTVVYDNSSEPGPLVVACLTRGQVVGTLTWPQWTPAPLWQRWADTAYLKAAAKEHGDRAEHLHRTVTSMRERPQTMVGDKEIDAILRAHNAKTYGHLDAYSETCGEVATEAAAELLDRERIIDPG
ncbi:hypothetical protein BKG69_15930 [Mycobacteroides chelonae]|nr:hypothetical protein BKG69_15930 [Mycobacteroides chelonae]